MGCNRRSSRAGGVYKEEGMKLRWGYLTISPLDAIVEFSESLSFIAKKRFSMFTAFVI